jgi:hypothetical protein
VDQSDAVMMHRISGWTIFYLIITGVFCIGWTEPGLMGASLFGMLAIANHLMEDM